MTGQHTGPGTALGRVLAALEQTGTRHQKTSTGWSIHCPTANHTHGDRNASLSLTQGRQGALLHCHTGCTTDDVTAALGLTLHDLFDTDPTPSHPIPYEYDDYTNADGTVLYRKLRCRTTGDDGEPTRTFRVTHLNGDGTWKSGIGPHPRVLYRLPGILAAIATGTTVWIAEGERDVNRLRLAGATATCNFDGASRAGDKPKWRPEYSDILTGAHTRIVIDCDSPGLAHGRAIAASLTGKAASIKLLRPALDFRGADIRDHLDAGLTLDDLIPVTDDYTPPTGDAAAIKAQKEAFDREVASETRKLRIRDAARRQLLTGNGAPGTGRGQLIPGGAFIHEAPTQVPSLWGRGEEVLWAAGEPLIITGPTGVGKTTLGGQVIAGRLGLIPHVLGFPVTPGKRVLYLAMDRPSQIARALARVLRSCPRDVLDERIVFWKGPPPADLAAHPGTLLELAQQAGADTVVLDSLKDAAVGLSSDETGYGINTALQLCIAAGVEVIAYHHQTKRGVGDHKPNTLADVYGSGWITAGAGSVLLLWGDAGDPVIELSHLKSPAGEVGPLTLVNDMAAGTMDIVVGDDVLDLLLAWPRTATEVAVILYGVASPGKAQIEKARRKIVKLVGKGLAVRLSDPSTGGAASGSKGGGEGARYGAAAHGIAPRSLHETPLRSTRSCVSAGESVHAAEKKDQAPDDVENRPTESVHVAPHPTPENPISAGESVHADRATSLHAPSGGATTSGSLITRAFQAGDQGDGQRGDHEKKIRPHPSDDLWVRAHLTTTPQTLDQLTASLGATTATVALALARLETTGTATCRAGHWALTTAPQAKQGIPQ